MPTAPRSATIIDLSTSELNCLPLGDLDRERIADIDRKLSLKLDASQLAANTANRIRIIARASVQSAMEAGAVAADVWPQRSKTRARRKVARTKRNVGVRALPSPTAMAQAIDAIVRQQPGQTYRVMTAVVYYAGLRPSEVGNNDGYETSTRARTSPKAWRAASGYDDRMMRPGYGCKPSICERRGSCWHHVDGGAGMVDRVGAHCFTWLMECRAVKGMDPSCASRSILVQVGRLWLARHWRSFVSAAVTISVCFGLAFFAIAGARRTQSAYPRFLEHAHSSTISVGTSPYDDATDKAIAAIPEVRESRTNIGVGLYPLVDGKPDVAQSLDVNGTFNGRYFDQDKFTPTQGRIADADRSDEVMVNEFGAERFDYHVGQHFDLGLYTFDQFSEPTFFAAPPPPVQIVSVTLVGIGVFPDEILQDDADRTSRFLVTPALSRSLTGNFGLQGLILEHGDDDVRGFLDHLAQIVPLADVGIRLTSVDEANALTATHPLSLVLGVFGAIAAVVGTVLSCQALGRSIRSTREDMRLVAVFGASNRDIAGLSLLASALAATCGVILGAIVAIAASPLMPIGPVRRVDPGRGLDVDFTVVAAGGLATIAVLIASSAWVAWRETKPADRRPTARATTTPTVGHAAGARLPPPAATGVRFALGDRNRVGARSAIISAVAASVAVVAAVTFAASLSRLVRVPSMFGWNFDAAVVSGNGYDNLDEARVHEILDNDFAVTTWSGAYFGADAVGDVDVPLIGMQPDSTVRPTLVDGRFIDDDTEIVLGQATARALHAHIGDDIVLKGDGSPHNVRVVGIAVLPTIGKTHAQHTSLGRGAIVVPGLVPGSDLNILGAPADKPLGPNAVFVRFMPGVVANTELAHLRQTTAPLTRFAGLDVLAVQRPAEIVSSDEVGAAPVLLAIGLAVGATIALVIVLVSSVRSHHRELAVLTALGFTRKQRAATLMWHSTVVVTFGLLIGIPLGAVVGRALWQVFAKRIDVAAPAVAPWGAIALIVLCALFLAVALGLGPARAARRLNVSAALRDQ